MKAQCRIGTSGWVYKHWQGPFYPSGLRQSDWYAYYAKHFETVEVNYSFYRLPSEKSFNRWQEQAPPGFVYALKANRFLTHITRLKDIGEPLETFLSRARLLGTRLGPILWQLPPRFPPDEDRLEALAAALPSDLIHAFEFRDPRWFRPATRRMLERHHLSFCIFDMPNLPCPDWITSKTIYVRFHGCRSVYGGLYGEKELQPWAGRIQQWLATDHDVYAYFNNDAFGFALQDARTLQELLERP
jgi:uncharacterized protein YecE (DUF72 family)